MSKMRLKVEEVAQRVKSLLHKHEGLKSDPRRAWKSEVLAEG